MNLQHELGQSSIDQILNARWEVRMEQRRRLLWWIYLGKGPACGKTEMSADRMALDGALEMLAVEKGTGRLLVTENFGSICL